ncbi:hypothetical protein K431DRAFT_320289 [Polychaeton citri CBS 116435]|uniref:N-acetyltransferase domain-containing protein n=1 Tax=Polychaeton citri CBS 116435 TaxID=1314669 RepID=A0A9P4UR18_9PEZI|nr:hypothetical protein K431DRAFT_320289 [Polychaeton citri CBS 116435]
MLYPSDCSPRQQTSGRQIDTAALSLRAGRTTVALALHAGIPDSHVDTAAAAAGTRGGDDVRVLGLHEYKQAAESLADAFAKDHVAWYLIDTPDRADWSFEQKWQLHVEIFEYIVYAHLLKGLVVCAGPNYDCVALWMPPGSNMDDLLTICRSGMWRLNYKLSKEGRKRFFNEFLPLLHDTKLQVMGDRDEQSWYLVYLGTKSTSRGKGYARKVIEYVSRQADADARACYLESSNPVNRIIYGKLGYQFVKSIYLQRDKEHVELDIMVREPIRVESHSGVEP